MRVKRLVLTIVAAFAISMGYGGVAIGAESRAPATVRVGVDMTNLAFDGYMVGGPACGIGTDYESLASVSPHGRRFVVVVRKGDLKRRVNQYSILLWKIGQSGPEGPSRILRMSSSTYNPAIDPGTLVWGRNGRSITFQACTVPRQRLFTLRAHRRDPAAPNVHLHCLPPRLHLPHIARTRIDRQQDSADDYAATIRCPNDRSTHSRWNWRIEQDAATSGTQIHHDEP